MPRTTLTKTTGVGPNPTAGVAVTMTAADVTNKNQFTLTGREILIVHNTHATTAFTFTVTSIADPYGRTGHITAESIAAGAIKALGPFSLEGWKQTDNYLYCEASDASVKFGVYTLP